MKRSNAARPTFWLAMIFVMAFLSPAESGDRPIAITTQKARSAAPITIVDQNGRPAVNRLNSPKRKAAYGSWARRSNSIGWVTAGR
jgi:hypothetical protein